MDILGITSRECDQSSAGFLADMGGKHILYPCGQQQCDKSQDLFLPAPERDVSGLYPRCKGHLAAIIPSEFPITPKPQCSTEGCHHPASPKSPLTQGTQLSKAPKRPGSDTNPGVLLLEPHCPAPCCLVLCSLRMSLQVALVALAPRPSL